ncbi:nucleoside-diphosphate-sugar epimerase [Pseudonocardia hierapolitana]|uniref:Nucleoside-diphosphate-sugar epimerase n=1 Tax=Pseudonocardia hierapolitana TaxID=1128676 RepID=A0A561SP37_9PSEU|nr:SDR family oxidoreductase [Pseudonocardia hierapolitana]TWF76620.1 nucleoside-diphosphate-sugar epimerase [Pseudonocardia hierapolitana]
MRIAVTGATGFVGGAVARAAAAHGWTVHGYGRARWDITKGPLADPPPVDAVVHAAAAVIDWGPAAPIRRANVDGTRNALASFPGARFVHVSTASVYDPFVPTVNAPEPAAPVARYLTEYGASKAAAERLLAGRPDTVVLRPHAVYGPGDPTLLPRLLGAIRGRTLVLPGDARTRHTLTAVGTLVDAVLRACDRAAPAGVYNIGDAEPVVLGDAVSAVLAERGLDVEIRYVPVRAAWALAAVTEYAARLARRPGPPRLTRYAVSHLGYERTLDLTAARTRLGLDPGPTSFEGAAEW